MAPTRVCIIGTGSSGIVAAKTLKQHQQPFDCFEKGSGIGGNWRYLNDNGMSSAYASLHINTSRERMSYSDFPMPADYPPYPHHSQILAYFERYVDHFGIRDHITFSTTVTSVRPAPGGWQVTCDDGRSDIYRAVLVANGHHWSPKWPSFAGHFAGTRMHSHDYKTPQGFEGRRVLVVGIGNSAVDIACELSRVAARTLISTRRSAHIIPKFVLGRPQDSYTSPAISRLPLTIQRMIYNLLLLMVRGPQERYGLPTPQHPILAEHPTISADLLNLIGHGRIVVKPNIQELCGDRVAFIDGSIEPVDTIIYATGYQVSLPFFAPGLVSAEDNQIRLYRRVVHPDQPGLYFIGLIQPLGAIMPLAELQSQWVAKLLTGECVLPDRPTMLRTIEQEQRSITRRYINSARHTLQVDFFPYKEALEHEIAAGRRHAVGRVSGRASPP